MGLLNYTPELDPNGQQVNRTAAMGNGVVNPGVPVTEPVYYGDSADPKKKRKVSPWTLLGAGLLGGVWAQHNPQGFGQAMGQLGQGLQRQQELELRQQQIQQRQAEQAAEEERWRSNDQFAREKFTYQQGQDKADRERQARIDAQEAARRAEEFKTTSGQAQARIDADKAADASKASDWNAEQYGTRWGTPDMVRQAGATAVNALLPGMAQVGGMNPYASGLLPQVQPQQIPSPPLAQSYINNVAMGEGRNLRNEYNQATMDARIDYAGIRNEGLRLSNELKSIDAETRPQERQLRLQILRNQIAREPLTRTALQQLILGRQIDNRWAVLLNMDRVLEGSGYTINPDTLLGFGGTEPLQPFDPGRFSDGTPFPQGGGTTLTEVPSGPNPPKNTPKTPLIVPKKDNNKVKTVVYGNNTLASAGATGLDIPTASAIFDKYADMYLLDSSGRITKNTEEGSTWDANREKQMLAEFKAAREGKTAPTPNFSRGGPFSPEDDVLKRKQQRVNELKGPK